jgi:hypothetical protein
MPATCSRKIACPDCGHSYARPIWLARHRADAHRRVRARARARSIELAPPPPPRAPHPQPDMSFAPNHDPVTDDVLMAESPAPDAGSEATPTQCSTAARVERFSEAGTPTAHDDDARHPSDRDFDPSQPWKPFESEADFVLARFMVTFDISQVAMDNLLKTVLPVLGVNHPVSSVYHVKQRIDEMEDGLGHQSWTRETTNGQWTDAHPEPISFYRRDILTCARWLLRQPAYDGQLKYAPERHFNEEGGRIYTEMHTCDWWWEKQVCVPLPTRGGAPDADGGIDLAARWRHHRAAHLHV